MPVQPSIRRRRERKYLVGQRQLAALHERIAGLLEDDVHGAGSRGYYNHSIYFDSPRYCHYIEKREGLAMRRKPQLRSYRSEIAGEPGAIFLEFKNRANDVIWKQRQRLDLSEARSMLSPIPRAREVGQKPLLDEFDYCTRRFNLLPAATVLYHRRAFSVADFPGLRVTYDRAIFG